MHAKYPERFSAAQLFPFFALASIDRATFAKLIRLLCITSSIDAGRSDAPVVELRPEDLVEDLLLALAEVDGLLLRSGLLLLLTHPLTEAAQGKKGPITRSKTNGHSEN